MEGLEHRSQEPATAEHLFQQGYSVMRNQLSPLVLEAAREEIKQALAALSPENRERFRFQGSMIPIHYKHPLAQLLVPSEGIIRGLSALGFLRPHWMSGYVISKPPHSPALWWHQDWWAWDEPCSTDRTPPQLFINVYLQKTTIPNGCLRLLPGTHKRRVPLHGSLPIAHSDDANAAPVDSPIFAVQEGEVSVEVEPGDLVFGDVRLLHATHPNTTAEERTCIVLWYLPDFDALPASIRSFMNRHHCLPPHGWWNEQENDVPPTLCDLLPKDDGPELPITLNRIPGALLRSTGE